MSSDGELSNAEDDLNIGHYEGGRNEDDQRHGFGTAFFGNGDTYEGMYENGKRHGKGVYRFSCGSYYDGNYAWNQRDGHGIFVYPDGSKYEGEWQADTRHGKGTYYYINGDTYEGEWFRNRKNGTGKYTDKATNSVVKATWHDGKLNGQCQINYGHFSYQGRYIENVIKGTGKFAFPNSKIEVQGGYQIVETEEESLPEEGKPIKLYRSVWSTLTLRPLEDNGPVEDENAINVSINNES